MSASMPASDDASVGIALSLGWCAARIAELEAVDALDILPP
jgi:hypothetical protein